MRKQYKLDQRKTPLFDALKRFAEWDPVPFFIPSHKMGGGIDPGFKSFAGDNIFRIDLSEVRWTDDFHGASTSIKEAQDLAADAWGAESSYFLVNGTSGGIIAAMCSVMGEGDLVIVPRNAHKSAVYGLVISGAEPVYVMPEIVPDMGLIGGLTPETLEKTFREHPGIRAVFTVSPTYHGIMSDTAGLAEITHKHGAVLIADEAHGNHMYFSERLPRGALELGADIVCQSTHKMSGALTQASMLHLGRDSSKRVDKNKIRANLSMIQTTSPSYILLASLDAARSYIATRGEVLLEEILDALDKARAEIASIPGIGVLGRDKQDKGDGSYCPADEAGIFGYEPTRLVISARDLGVDGYELFRILREDYGVECEFADPVWCVCVAGLGTTQKHTEALVRALTEISHRSLEISDKSLKAITDTIAGDTPTLLPPIPPLELTPRKAWFAEKETVPFEEALGRISAEMVVPYPPGIPVLCPGEIVTEEVHEFLAKQKQAGRHMHCSAGDSLSTLTVVV